MGCGTHYICSEEMEYNGIVGGEVEVMRDME
jgi:hypothetical protein